MITASVITIGTELTTGYVGDLNSTHIAKALLDINVRCTSFIAVPDGMNEVLKALDWASGNDVVVVTGGLGPTADDITRDALAAHFGVDLIIDETAEAAIKERMLRGGRDATKAILKQAYKPQGAELIAPERGTAPGVIMWQGKSLWIALPGVPQEVEEMMSVVKKTIIQRFPDVPEIVLRRLFLFGPSEVDVEECIADLLPAPAHAEYNILSTAKGIEVNLFGEVGAGENFIAQVFERIEDRLAPYIFSYDGTPIENIVGNLLASKSLTMATAESCTGGLIAERLTSVSGASDYFRGAIVSYANEVKQSVLSVPVDVINKMGAVSKETAMSMAENVRLKLDSDIGVSVTGIAGPTGGSPEKPVGTVYIALADAKSTKVEQLNLRGGRERIRFRSSQCALDLVRRHLSALPDKNE